jgi:hypothetical protein
MGEEKQLSLMDLLAELRGEASAEVQKEAWLYEQSKAFVRKNRAGIMSAMIKALRMQKTKHALFYGALLLEGGQDIFYVRRRLLIDACEDGVDTNVIEYMAKLYQKPLKQTSELDLLLGIVMICQGANWWNCEYGQKKTSVFLTSKNVPTPESDSIEELMNEMERLCFEGGYENARKSSAVLRRLRELKQDPHDYHEWLTDACIRKGKQIGDEGLVRAGTYASKVLNRRTGFKDGNWQLVLRCMLCMGSTPGIPSYEEATANALKLYSLCKKFLLIAKERLKDPTSIELPSWAYDGMHASNKKLYPIPDRRFPGTEQGFYNGLLQARKYGRLDPRDQAVLDSCKVPDEYLRLYNEWIDDVEA